MALLQEKQNIVQFIHQRDERKIPRSCNPSLNWNSKYDVLLIGYMKSKWASSQCIPKLEAYTSLEQALPGWHQIQQRMLKAVK